MTRVAELLDPTGERNPLLRQPVSPPATLNGLTIGLLDISKPRGDVFLDRVAGLFAVRGLSVRRFGKPTYAKAAPPEIATDIARHCDVVVEALAD